MTNQAYPDNNEPSVIRHQYRHEVMRATYHLFLLLQERKSGFVKPTYPHQPEFQFPLLPDIDIYPVLDEYEPEPPQQHNQYANQLAFKGWIAHIYGIWDSHFRPALRDAFSGDDIILPEEDVMGDLGYIRNDLLHHAGKASVNNVGRCKMLTWFQPGDPMILELRHVYDFMNQADILAPHPSRPDHNTPNAYSWSFCRTIPEASSPQDVPKVVSIKTSADNDSEDGSPRFMMRVVFENGVFSQGPLPFHNPNISPAKNQKLFDMTTIDQNGEILFKDGRRLPMVQLYNACVRYTFGERGDGLGMWGNWVRFRR